MAAAALARRGARVFGFDLRRPPHDMGSTHGGSRVARTAYFEHPDYVPLLRTAMAGWDRLEQETGRRCLHRCGVLLLGGEQSEVLNASRRSAEVHRIDVEELDPDAIERRWPMFHLPLNTYGLLEPDSGFVVPEFGIEAALAVAQAHGADLRFDCRVNELQANDEQARIELATGETLEVDRVVVTAGPWTGELLGDLLPGVMLQPTRQVIVWSRPRPNHASAMASDRLPAWLYDDGGGFGDGVYYAVPAWPGQVGPEGVKVGFHGPGTVTGPEEICREVHPDELARFAADLECLLPGVLEPPHAAATCLYTMSADQHFVIDRSPVAGSVQVLGGFSGHGYKFAPVMGEIAADLALDGSTSHPIGFLRLASRRLGPRWG